MFMCYTILKYASFWIQNSSMGNLALLIQWKWSERGSGDGSLKNCSHLYMQLFCTMIIFAMSLLQRITLINMLMSYLKMYLNLIFQIIYLLWSEKHFIYIFMLFYCFAMICCLILLPCVIHSVCSESICNIIQYLQLWFHALRVYNLIFLCIIQIELKIFLFNK